MALILDKLGQKSDPVPFSYTEDTVILYALGIGAGVKDLDFVYEKNLKVYPTFAVIPFMPMLLSTFVPSANVNLFALLHGEQKIILHKQIPTSGTVYSSVTWDSVYDKRDKGAIINLTFETESDQGELLFENKVVLIDRSAGNFDGDRGEKAVPVVIPKDRGPDFQVEENVPLDQAALYRLSGDKNPLHIDPAFAKKGGLDRPIMHGLCTYGYVGRILINKICDNDPLKLKEFSVRFMNMVYPGDTLTTEIWKVEGGAYVLRTVNQDGKMILGNASAIVI